MSQGRYCRPAYQASQSHDSGTAVSRSGRSFLDHEPNSPYGCCARPHPILSLGSATTVAMDGTRALDIWCGTGRTIPHWSTSSAQSPRASSLALSCCKAERERAKANYYGVHKMMRTWTLRTQKAARPPICDCVAIRSSPRPRTPVGAVEVQQQTAPGQPTLPRGTSCRRHGVFAARRKRSRRMCARARNRDASAAASCRRKI